MHDSERSLYLENPKRPYSWTGELDSPPSPNTLLNGSLKLSKGSHGVGNVKEFRTKHERRSSAKELSRASGSGKRGQFNCPRSGSQLLADKLPSYLTDDGKSLSKEEILSMCTPHNPISKTSSANGETKSNGQSTGGLERKRSKFGNLRRKSPPTAMTSHVSDFEYFSLSDPPPGLARPVQIFPPCSKPKQPEKRRKRDPEPDKDPKSGEKCRDCMTRIPYATLIATIMCCVGVGVFCGTMYRGTTLTLLMFDEVFRIKITWVEPVQLTFMIIGAAMGGLGLMILFLGCLSTGSTRAKVYRTWRGRVGGRVSCAIFMGITYLLAIIWLLMFIVLIVVTVFYTLAWFQCQVIPENQCIDYNQFEFLFPSSTTEEDRRVCREERKTFCKDCVNNAEVMFILATVAAFLVIMSLVHYLMCLSSNYAHIKDQEKFIDLQEIQYLHESEMSTLPKDRF